MTAQRMKAALGPLPEWITNALSPEDLAAAQRSALQAPPPTPAQIAKLRALFGHLWDQPRRSAA